MDMRLYSMFRNICCLIAGGEGTPEQQAHLMELMSQLQEIEARQGHLQDVVTKSTEAQNKKSATPTIKEEEEKDEMDDKPKKKAIIPSGGLVGFRVASDLLKQVYMEEKETGPNPGGLWQNQ